MARGQRGETATVETNETATTTANPPAAPPAPVNVVDKVLGMIARGAVKRKYRVSKMVGGVPFSFQLDNPPATRNIEAVRAGIGNGCTIGYGAELPDGFDDKGSGKMTGAAAVEVFDTIRKV